MTDEAKVRWKVGLLVLKYSWLDAKARWGCRLGLHRPWKMRSNPDNLTQIGWTCACKTRWWPSRDSLEAYKVVDPT